MWEFSPIFALLLNESFGGAAPSTTTHSIFWPKTLGKARKRIFFFSAQKEIPRTQVKEAPKTELVGKKKLMWSLKAVSFFLLVVTSSEV